MLQLVVSNLNHSLETKEQAYELVNSNDVDSRMLAARFFVDNGDIEGMVSLSKDDDLSIRRWVAYGLCKLNVREEILQMSGDCDSFICQIILDYFWQSEDVEGLVVLFVKKPHPIGTEAGRFLVKMGAIELIVDLTDHPNTNVQERAAQLLSDLLFG